ncbi:MAG: DMT family transporter [Gammaproteobacteria bacterium]|nr:DMT family transporter [Gammaproteobacteria bacterium]
MSPRAGWTLLATAVVLWGVNWPVMKIGLDYIGPLWFAAIRVIIGALVLFVFLGLWQRITFPGRSDLPVVLSVGVVQVGICMALLHSSLLYLEAGRAAVLAYTIPIWTAPLAALFLREALRPRKLAGIFLGVSGVAALFHTQLVGWQWQDLHPGQALPLLSAVCWAAVIVHIRGHGWTQPHLSLLPWQLAIGALLLSSAAFYVEGVPSVPAQPVLIAALLYNGLLGTALAFWAYIGAARILPAGSTSLGSLAIPVVGLLSASLLLNEAMTLWVLSGMALIGAGILLSTAVGD